MNEIKLKPNIINNENQKKEESYEDYQVIKEDYCSSPKCGIKSKIVTKSVEKMIFSPIEISSKPYFKYCVSPAKDEYFKYDFSQSETNHTRYNEDKNKKKSFNNISNYQKNSYLLVNNNELKEEKKESEEENDNITEYLKCIDKKENEMNLTYNFYENNENKSSNKDKKTKLRNKNKKEVIQGNMEIEDNDNHSIILKGKRKYSLNDIYENENNNIKKKIKKSQKNINAIFNFNEENNNNIYNSPKIIEDETNKIKTSHIFKSMHSIKENYNLKKKFSPFKASRDKPSKVLPSYTSTNINRFKKKKKSQDTIKKTKTTNYMIKPFMDNKKSKEIKEKIKNIIINNDNSDDNLKRIKKEKNMIKKIKNLKIKNIGEYILNNKRINSERKDLLIKDYQGKRRTNNFVSFKLKMNDNFLKDYRILEIPNTAKKRKNTRIDYFNFDEKNILLTVKREKDNLIKNNFSNIGEIEKDKNKNKDKENNSNIKRNKLKEKKEKTKSKRKEKYKMKEKEKEKNTLKENKILKKFSAKNLKLVFREEKEARKDSLTRKDKSLTQICNNKNKNKFFTNNLNKTPKMNQPYNSNSNKCNNNVIKRMNSRDLTKNNCNLNLGTNHVNQRYIRRNSTKIIHKKSEKEKITEFTNKQNIDNINEYTRKCLEIIPDLYSLEEMPRCKSKIHPTLNDSKNLKKIALFDLDETIVHCIGEINMNNVDNFTRQSDTKLKVKLPGGKEVIIGINIRPHWKEALNIIKNKYHIIAYTASHESYADSVLNYLDPENKYFEYRLYRCHCVLCSVDEIKFYVKDLGIFQDFYSLKDIVLIDNSVLSFAYHLDNGIPISPFYDSKNDCELLDIANFLFKYADENDIRDKLREVYKLSEYLEIIKNNNITESFTSSSSISIVKEDEESETTKKHYINDKHNSNLNNNNSGDYNIIIEENKEEQDDINEDKIAFSKKSKNSSQKNFNFKEVMNNFEKISVDNNKRNRSYSYKEKKNKQLDINKINDIMNSSRIFIGKNLGMKKKKKFRSFRYCEINFKKEWDEKQKALNNK